MSDLLAHQSRVRIIRRHRHNVPIHNRFRPPAQLSAAQLNLAEERLPRRFETPTRPRLLNRIHRVQIMPKVVIVLARVVESKVAGLSKNFRQSFDARRQPNVVKIRPHALPPKRSPPAPVVVNSETGLHRADDNRRARRRTNSRRRVKTIKANPLFRQRIQVRRLDQRLAVTTEPTADVLQINPKNVRTPLCLFFARRRRANQPQNRRQQNQNTHPPTLPNLKPAVKTFLPHVFAQL